MHDTRLHCSRPTMILLCAALASLCAITAGASDRRGSDDAQRGSFFATFDTRSRQSGPKAVHKRFGARAGRRIRDYHIEDETFKVIVPESYDPKTPFGVFVFITPDDDNRTMGDAAQEGRIMTRRPGRHRRMVMTCRGGGGCWAPAPGLCQSPHCEDAGGHGVGAPVVARRHRIAECGRAGR